MGAVRAGKNLQIRARPLFVDGHVIAISKPSGVVSQMHGRRNDCIHDSHHDAKALEPILDDLVTKFGLNSKPIPVHRLDKVTWLRFLARSGIVHKTVTYFSDRTQQGYSFSPALHMEQETSHSSFLPEWFIKRIWLWSVQEKKRLKKLRVKFGKKFAI